MAQTAWLHQNSAICLFVAPVSDGFCNFSKNRAKYPPKSAVKKLRRALKATGGASSLNKMQLPVIDRTPNMRPVGADLASTGANRVIPTAPVNPPEHESLSIQPAPSVIDMVNPALKAPEGTPVYANTADSVKADSREDQESPKDWTIHRPQTEKVENPPPKPLYQVLLDHVKSMWNASASVVQLDQVNNQINSPLPVSPSDLPGVLAKEALVYTPHTVKKTEKI